MCLRILAFFAVLLLSPAALAVQKVNLDPVQTARAETGERIQVLVWVDTGAIHGIEPSEAEDLGEPHLRLPEGSVEAVLERILGYPAAQMARPSQGENRPSLLYAGRYTPVAAMSLTGSEIARLAADPAVTRIETDALYAPSVAGTMAGTGIFNLHDQNLRGAGVSVAVLDTGVDFQHPMFTGRIIDSACFSGTSDPSGQSFCPGGVATDTTSEQAGDNCEGGVPGDVVVTLGCDHGTHVAGIAAGSAYVDELNNNYQTIGMAPEAGIVAVQVFSRFARQDYCEAPYPCALSHVSNQLAALEWLYANRQTLNLAAVNMSLGGAPVGFHCPSNTLAPIIRNLRAAGILTAIASGNNGLLDQVTSPACIEEAVAVGGIYGNGTTFVGNHGHLVDIYAPGSNIRSALPTIGDAGPGSTSSKTGTSMATPFVAGAIAVLRAAHPGVSADAIETALLATAVPTWDYSLVDRPDVRLRVDRAHDYLTHNAGGLAGGVIEIAPATPFYASERLGEEFPSNPHTYVLTNRGDAETGWVARADVAWLRFSIGQGSQPTAQTVSGTLQPGESVTLIVGAVGRNDEVQAHYNFGSFEIAANNAPQGLRIRATAYFLGRRPINDDFASAIPIPHVNAYFHNGYATREPGEPQHGSAGNDRSLWWWWVAPRTQRVAITAFRGSPIDNGPVGALAVYQGDSLDNLTRLNSIENYQPSVAIDAVEGERYMIAVEGYQGTSFQAVMWVEIPGPPANDIAATAQVLEGDYGVIETSSLRANTEYLDINPDGRALYGSVWYSWTPSVSGRATFLAIKEHQNSPSEIRIFVPTGDGGQTRIAWSGSSLTDPVVSFDVEAGQRYLIAYGKPEAGWHDFALTWRMGEGSTTPLRMSVLPNARAVRAGQAVTVFASVSHAASADAPARNCIITYAGPPSQIFEFAPTEPTTNVINGPANMPFDLQPGETRSFVLTETFFHIDYRESRGGGEIRPRTVCGGMVSPEVRGLTSAEIWIGEVPPPDPIAIVATLDGSGVVRAPVNGTTAFSVSAINIGASGEVLVVPYHWSDQVNGHAGGLTIRVCETDPASGVCLTPRVAELPITMAAGEIRTFTVFVTNGSEVFPLAPASRRIRVRFSRYGQTSVAYATAQ